MSRPVTLQARQDNSIFPSFNPLHTLSRTCYRETHSMIWCNPFEAGCLQGDHIYCWQSWHIRSSAFLARAWWVCKYTAFCGSESQRRKSMLWRRRENEGTWVRWRMLATLWGEIGKLKNDHTSITCWGSKNIDEGTRRLMKVCVAKSRSD